jgi:hypothetical protein
VDGRHLLGFCLSTARAAKDNDLTYCFFHIFLPVSRGVAFMVLVFADGAEAIGGGSARSWPNGGMGLSMRGSKPCFAMDWIAARTRVKGNTLPSEVSVAPEQLKAKLNGTAIPRRLLARGHNKDGRSY